MNYERAVSLLQTEFVPAVGCTEPVAIALTCAKAYHAVGGRLVQLELDLSSNVFKNARAVGIPGTEDTGIETSALLGVVLDAPDDGLEIFSSMTEHAAVAARKLRKTAIVRVTVDSQRRGLYVLARIVTDRGSATAIAVDRHTHIRIVEVNGEAIPEGESTNRAENVGMRLSSMGTFDELVECIMQAPVGVFDFLIDCAMINLDMAEKGLGSHCDQEERVLPVPGMNLAADYAAAACLARMEGVLQPVSTCAGSGNVGISATVPLLVEGRSIRASRDTIARSLALSLTITIYIKEHLGLLSPVCGCAVAAGAGTAAGIAYMRGGNASAVADAASSVLATLAGMLCDGGKAGCALKVWTSAVTAGKAASLALLGRTVPSGNGIVGGSLDETILTLAELTSKGMAELDRVLVDMMRVKYGCI